MASSIASPVPLHFDQLHQKRNDLRLNEQGRETPLPQYEKTQKVPFTLDLQEDARNPGQFQLVVNVGPKPYTADSVPIKSPQTPSSDDFAALGDGEKSGMETPLPHLVPKPPPQTSSLQGKEGWADLDHVHPDFIQTVVPDWGVSFTRNGSTASTQPNRLNSITARIKKKGKGYVVRLLKGSSPDSNEVAEVDLGQQPSTEAATSTQAHDSTTLPAELYSPPMAMQAASDSILGRPDVHEIGTSNESGVQPQQQVEVLSDERVGAAPLMRFRDSLIRNSIAEDIMSDAETLVPSADFRTDQGQTDFEPLLNNPLDLTRSTSVSSIVKTPTRGLTLVGPVRRMEKSNRVRIKGKTASLELRRSDAQKSIKRRSPRDLTNDRNTNLLADPAVQTTNLRQRIRPATRKYMAFDLKANEDGTEQHSIWPTNVIKPRHSRHASAENLQVPPSSKNKLRLQTNIPLSKSANSSPVTRKKRSPRTRRRVSSSPDSIDFVNGRRKMHGSPEWSEVDPEDQLREALGRALGSRFEDDEDVVETTHQGSIPTIVEPIDERIGEIPLPSEIEIRSAPAGLRSPVLMFWGLALSALSDKVYEGFKLLRDSYGTEPPVPQGHVRVRWTCSCGEALYDDFIEQRPNAARLLEAYLNRPRAHTPRSPASQSSTASSMSSIFDPASRASTLETPSSTYGGQGSWTRGSDPSKYSPTRIRNNSSFSVRMPTYAQESWLLACANEGRLTPKIVHLDVNEGRIRSDKDLALALREHYDQLNQRWLNWMRLRGLATIEFVQFEVHRNRFADIRATPSMPPKSAGASVSNTAPEKAQAPSQHPYTFEPNDLLPPVGSTYLLHLFKHPADYDGELITYLRSPKRRQRLEFGMGWGVHLVEGFLAQRVWLVTMGICAFGSAIFAIVYAIKGNDIQGAFGVAQWMLGLAVLVVGGLQTWLE